MTGRLIRITTALAVVAVAGVAAIISYQHAYELVTSHGETGITARLLPFTVDGFLIWAASMVVLDASHRNHRVSRLAAWSLAAGIMATIGANVSHGLGHGSIGLLVSAWPAVALVGSFELLMLLIRTQHQDSAARSADASPHHAAGRTTSGPAGILNRADGASEAQRGPQPASDSPRTEHRPPQSEADYRPGRNRVDTTPGPLPNAAHGPAVCPLSTSQSGGNWLEPAFYAVARTSLL